MLYVIGFTEPDSASGCIYWSGSMVVEPGGDILRIGEATSHNVLVVTDACQASALALWLNTSPALHREPGQAHWQAMPIPAKFGSAA